MRGTCTFKPENEKKNHSGFTVGNGKTPTNYTKQTTKTLK